MSSDLPDELFGGSDDGQSGESRGPGADPVERKRMVIFELGDETYAADVDAVKTTVEPREHMTRVPRTTEAIDGLMDLRGEITAVINPRIHFGVTAPPADEEAQRIVVFDRASDQQPAAIRVDRVVGVEAVPVPTFYGLDEIDTDEVEYDADLVAAVIQRQTGDTITERIAVVDTEALIEASGAVAVGLEA